MICRILVIIFLFVNIAIAYQLSSILVNFTDAIAHCQTTYNSSLATIFTPRENKIISELCSSNGINNCWIETYEQMDHNEWYPPQIDPKPEYCAAIHADTQNTIDNGIYKGQLNRVSCDSLLHPICNDVSILNEYGSNHNRKLLQSFLCDEIYSDTCVITADYFFSQDILCTSIYPNCEISIGSYNAPGHAVHCPQNYCISCRITFTESSLEAFRSLSELSIMGHNCQELLIDVNVYGDINSWDIFAPGNRGTLNITVRNGGRMANSRIYSSFNSSRTENIIFTTSGDGSTFGNAISGEYIAGDLNFSCLGNAMCSYTNISCGVGDTGCNIVCASEYNFGCEFLYVQVDLQQRESDVNWYCDDSNAALCFDSQLECNNKSNYSPLKYDDYNGWNFQTGDCFINWVPPSIFCSTTSDDKCYIIRQYLDTTRDIYCDNDLPHCFVQLGDESSDDVWPTDLHSIVHCPSSNCVSCVIQCTSYSSCYNITIFGYNCTSLEVNIEAKTQSNMQIYAPGNGGDLIVTTDIEYGRSGLQSSEIYSSLGTKSIVINIEDRGEYNFIHGEYVTDYLNVTCGTDGSCVGTEIICPNDADCNVYCYGQCKDMQVNALEGTHDVNWVCSDYGQYHGCDNAHLNCTPSYSQSSEWTYNSVSNVWKLDNNSNGCVDIPSIAPTLSPTTPTINPTESTSEPSMSPTSTPTQSPTAAVFLNEMEFAVIVSAAVVLFILIVGALIYYYKYYKPEELSLYIKNALVVLVGIAKYEETDDVSEIGGKLSDLPGLDHDIKHMINLFRDELNYDVFPSQYMNKDYSPKLDWTKKELNDFLVEKAAYVESNIEKYDGLIVVISCHGIPGYICTSDYKRFSKIEMHRIFSASHPKSREIPRLFLFDCCAGNNEQVRTPAAPDTDVSVVTEFMEEKDDIDGGKAVISKNISAVHDLGGGDLWIEGDHNPDYRLAVVEAANHGFQSKLRRDIGSYVIFSFYAKTMEILAQNDRTFIHETFDEIQDELHKRGTQHPTYVWNDDTRYIRFKANTIKNTKHGNDANDNWTHTGDSAMHIEMTEGEGLA